MTDDAYQDWAQPSPFLDAIGGFIATIRFVVEGGKLNGRGFLHAGAIAAVADAAIGHFIGAPIDPSARLVTVNLSCDLLGSARRDE